MSASNSIYDLENIRQQINPAQVLSLFGIPWDGHSNIKCLWHEDSTPSCQVYSDHLFCHGCRKWGDIFSLTMKLGKMPFDRAVEWLLSKKSILPATVVRKAPVEYKGDLPIKIAQYYHSQLDKERRQYLYDRLLTDETLDRNLIGYRADYQAYTIPFWSGYPGVSEIVSLQYRIAPWAANQKKKYWWEPGYYRPCVLNSHVINPALVVVAFGSIDGLLGAQDGLPMISASGLNTFANSLKIESIWLRDLLRDVQRIIVLPDATCVEFEPAVKVMQNLGADLKFFPYYAPGKDYNAYRISGESTVTFIKEILELTTTCWYNDRLYLLEQDHVLRLENMLTLFFSSHEAEARQELLQIAKDSESHSAVISHALQMLMGQYGPSKFNAPLNSEEWWEMIDNFAEAWESYTDLCEVLVKWYHRTQAKLGIF
jgi:hypothetical protein